MPFLDGVEAKIIHKEFPEIKIIALTSYDSNSLLYDRYVGASSYILKCYATELIKTITEVATKGFF
jgi:DNA-binding NarL/FixJ family response regulator